MVEYRKFRNADPPGLALVWNEVCTGRGAVWLPNSSPVEETILAKPYFDPDGLRVAVENGECLGFAHAGFGPDDTGQNLSFDKGVISFLGVRPGFRGRGIGSELLRQCENYLRERGAQTIYAGSHWPLNPFYLGLYGGCDSAGLLTSDALIEPFLTRRGYQVCQRFQLLQRRLDLPKTLDPRFVNHRQRFQFKLVVAKSLGHWWRDCVLGILEPVYFVLEDRGNQNRLAWAMVWAMEKYSWRWHRLGLGFLEFQVKEDQRRQGLGRFFFGQIIRHIQEEFPEAGFDVAEIRVAKDNKAGLEFCKALGFEGVDVGQVYVLKEEK